MKAKFNFQKCIVTFIICMVYYLPYSSTVVQALNLMYISFYWILIQPENILIDFLSVFPGILNKSIFKMYELCKPLSFRILYSVFEHSQGLT